MQIEKIKDNNREAKFVLDRFNQVVSEKCMEDDRTYTIEMYLHKLLENVIKNEDLTLLCCDKTRQLNTDRHVDLSVEII